MNVSFFWPALNRMHIPDNFLSFGVVVACWLVTLVFLSVAVRKSKETFGEQQIPLMGVMAAFIFAAQMINFPVAGGTSGHLLGGVLAAVTLGPWGGMLVMASVIGVQALLFQDGGLLVMGANILNMGVVSVLIGYGLYRVVLGRALRLRLTVIALGAWLAVMAGAFLASLELWLSNTASLRLVLPAMLGIHALIGIGEALITVAALSFIRRLRPDILEDAAAPRGGRGWIFGGLAAALGVIFLAPLASANPDGLQRVADDLGFAALDKAPGFGLLRGYSIPWLGNTSLSVIFAGLLGALGVAVLTYGLSRLLAAAKTRH
ncbi:MAG: energy-coupling factor ABC transporter permease [Anaerolineales bacterium]